MSDDEASYAERLHRMVGAIMDGAATAETVMLGGSTAVDGTILLNAFQFITAAMFEAHPDLAGPDDLREAAHQQGDRIRRYAERFRVDFEATGKHVWDEINAPAELMN